MDCWFLVNTLLWIWNYKYKPRNKFLYNLNFGVELWFFALPLLGSEFWMSANGLSQISKLISWEFWHSLLMCYQKFPWREILTCNVTVSGIFCCNPISSNLVELLLLKQQKMLVRLQHRISNWFFISPTELLVGEIKIIYFIFIFHNFKFIIWNS